MQTYSSTTDLIRLIEAQKAEIAVIEGYNAALLTERKEIIAERDELAIADGWQVPVSKRTRQLINRMPAGQVSVAVGDIANLKQLNTATGFQPRTDALFHPAFRVRADDKLIFGQRDSGDQFILVASNARMIAERINAELKDAPMSDGERRAYVQGVCVKRWGPLIGKVVHTLGLHTVSPYPHIDWKFVDDVHTSDVHEAANIAERGLFVSKRAILKGGM